MPIMYGIAAFAVLANGLDQVGVDPQIDKQYAIVKQGERITPAIAQTNSTEDPQVAPLKETGQTARGDHQEGSHAISFQVASSGAPAQSSKSELSKTLIISGQIAPASSGQTPPGLGQLNPAEGSLTILPSGVSQKSNFPFFAMQSDSLRHLKGMDRLVSIQFTNASASDVLKWLSKQNVNFVANVNKLPKSKVTMSVSQVPLHEALETVAECLGGSWQVKGSTLIFQNGMFHTMSFAPAKAGTLKSFETVPFGEMKSFGKMDKDQMKAFEKSMLQFKNGQSMMSQDFLKQMEDMKGLTSEGKAFTFKMDPKQLAEWKSLGMKDGKSFTYKWDPKQMEELKAFGMMNNGKGFKWDPKSFADMKGMTALKGFTFKKIDIGKFKKSLSNAQKELMKKQGHLKLSDLTESQRGMLFDKTSGEMTGDFTFVFSSDSDKITIKK